MKRTNRRAAAVAVVLGAVALAFGTSGPSAAPVVTSKTTVSSQAVLDWNVIAVNTVRGATPAKFQIEGQLYMTYVQAAVYDAVAAIKGKEDGKGKDTSFRKLKLSIPGASSRAAAASAALLDARLFLPGPGRDALPRRTPTTSTSPWRASPPTRSRPALPSERPQRPI